MTSESGDLTTDATPSPSRFASEEDQVPENIQKNIEEAAEFAEDIHNNARKSTFKGFAKINKTQVPTAQATIININNANGIHVGDKIVYNVNSRPEKVKPKPDVKNTPEIKVLTTSDKPVTESDLLFVAKHMDETWQDVARHLNYSEGEIQQFVIDHKHLGVKESIYQFLLDWTRNEETEVTVGKLCTILWKNNQKHVLKKWLERKN